MHCCRPRRLCVLYREQALRLHLYRPGHRSAPYCRFERVSKGRQLRRNVREEAAAEQRTSAEVIEAVYVINQTVNCMRQDAKRLIQHRRGEPAFKVVDIGEVPLDIKVVRESGACLQTIHTPVPEVSLIRMVRPEEPGVRMNFYLVLVTKEVRPRHDRKW